MGVIISAVLAAGVWLSRDRFEAARECAAVVSAASSARQPGDSCIDHAAQRLQMVVRRHPASADTFAALARFHTRLGRHEDAVRCWKRCKDHDPLSAGLADEALGGIALAEGRFEEATAFFRDAHRADPSSHTVSIQLAEALLASGRPAEALPVLDELLSLRSESLAAASLRGQVSLQLKDYHRAFADFSKAVAIGPDYAAAQHGLATAAARLGDEETARTARAAFERLHMEKEARHRQSLNDRDDDRDARIRCAMTLSDVARVHFAHAEAEDGLARLAEALRIDEREPSCWLLLGQVQEKRGRITEAVEAYRNAAMAQTEDPPQMLAIAGALKRVKAYEESEAVYRRVIANRPGWSAAYAACAQMLLESGLDPAEAVRLSRRAVDLEPSATLWGLVSEACERAGDREAAMDAVRRAITLAPDEEAWRRRLERLSGPRGS